MLFIVFMIGHMVIRNNANSTTVYILFCIVIPVTLVHGHSHTVEKSYEGIKLVSVVFVWHTFVAVIMSF